MSSRPISRGALSSRPSSPQALPGSTEFIRSRPVSPGPIVLSRPVSPEGLKKHDFYLMNTQNVAKPAPLAYPCRDKSAGVHNFSQWSYFKDAPPKKIKNVTSSHLWNKEFLDKINNRTTRNKASKKKKPLAPIRTTKAERLRKQYSRMVTRPPIEDGVSEASAVGGSLNSYVFSSCSETSSNKSYDFTEF